MKAWLLVGVVLTGASCHHAVPTPQPSAAPARYGFPAEAQDSDVFCVEAEANAAEPWACVHVGQVRYYVRSQRYAE